MRGEVDLAFEDGPAVEDGCFEVEDACFEAPVVATDMAESCGEAGGYILAVTRRSTSYVQQDDVN